MSFRRVLVANRGEIACRVIRTLRAMGIESAAVFSEPDRRAPHVLLADAAQAIGPAAARESYLDPARILDAARALGCDAVHPGYGFLSENEDFAAACAAEGLTFIGPTPEAIRIMGDKAEARKAAAAAGVPPVPGYEGDDDDASLRRAAAAVGFPLLVKAAAGGGGKGMRRVASLDELADACASARREARAAFGDDRLLLERLVRPARHVEVQVLGDAHGRHVHVLERECSLQRRHQKVIEECPSPAVDGALRARLGAAACALARQVAYRGAGTVEFLLEPDGRFWFLEMNTRLQVEHGVTELVAGIDLVEWQMRLAAGERLALEQEAIVPRGHALEARVYAEDPDAAFLPQAGRIERLVLPSGPGIRIDSGIREGIEVTPHYDPLLMKVLAHGSDRDQSRRRLLAALEGTAVVGPTTNVGYLADLLRWDVFRRGETYTHLLEDAAVPRQTASPEDALWLAVAALETRVAPAAEDGGQGGAADPHSPFLALGEFRIVDAAGRP